MTKTKIRVSMTLDERLIDTLKREADADGYSTIAPVVKRFMLKGLKADELTEGGIKSILVKLDNYQEIARYVQEKKFGLVENFITYAVAQHMARYPLTNGQKRRTDENTADAGIPR